MRTYLIERYVPRSDAADLMRTAEEARAIAAQSEAGGDPVRYLRSILVPTDELCLSLFEAPSAEALEEALRRAGMVVERIMEAIDMPASTGPMGSSSTLR